MTRLSLFSMSTAETIQRCERRSYSTPGSVGSVLGVGSTVLQKDESVRFRPPRFPCLSYDLIRPFTETRTWLGPTAPIESGGTKPETVESAPTNEVPDENDDSGVTAAWPVRCRGAAACGRRW